MGLGRFEPVIASELADVAQGGAVFKAVRGDYGCGKTFFGRWVQENAKKKGFATAEVQISETETPLHRLETVYRRAMEQLSTADCFLGCIPLRSSTAGSTAWKRMSWPRAPSIPADDEGPGRAGRRTAGAAARRDHSCHAAVRRRPACLPGGPAAERPRHRRRAGRLAGWAAPRRRLDQAGGWRQGGRGPLRRPELPPGLLLILKDSGYSGLVLVLDEIETLQRVRGDVREKGLNALRQLIDDIDGGRFPNLYLLTTGTPAFFDGPQGVQRLEPLAQRLHVDFQTDARFDNPRAVQLRLPPFDHDRLVEVGVKVRDLFVADCSSPGAGPAPCRRRLHRRAGPLRDRQAGRQGRHRPTAVPEEAGLGRAGPDRPVRRLRPRQHYQLTVNASEMTTVEREAQAQTVDDIELDV